ncbi:mucin-5AC isoform X5 [Oncorhynchus keta]|uniref:mucin-5AC isoform X5 n=1 Tax=Oncorhynchus keta TaxID=8018 RepID=UPI00227B7707|nr:mucin-5AC isoform X5 [Oncorhynchus keta]
MKKLWIMVVFATVSFPQGDLSTSSAIPTTIDITTPTTDDPLTPDPATTDTPTADTPTTYFPTNDFPITDTPITNFPTTDTPTTNFPTSDFLTTDMPTSGSPTAHFPTAHFPTAHFPTTDFPTTDFPTTEFPTPDTPITNTPNADNPATDTPTTDTPTTDSPATNTQASNNPASDNPATDTPTTDFPNINTPVTDFPTTGTPTADTPITDTQTTDFPTTDFLTTDFLNIDTPVTNFPTTGTPTADTPTNNSPTTNSPTTNSPTTDFPNIDTLVTDFPTTDTPTNNFLSTHLPTTDFPTADTPTTDTPTTDIPVTDIQANNNPASYTPVIDFPTTDFPTIDFPTTDSPSTNFLTTDTSTTDSPATDTHANNNPATNNPATDTPTTNFPTTHTPTTNVPTTNVPTTNVPTTDMPTTVFPTTDFPTINFPNIDTPVTDTPVTDFPTTDFPTTDFPTTDFPTTDSPSTNFITTDTPTTGMPTTDFPSTHLPTTDTPTTDSLATDTPATDTPTTDTPTTHLPTTDSPVTDIPAIDSQANNSPSSDTPATDFPTIDFPNIDTPVTDFPSNDFPTIDFPTTDSLSTNFITTNMPTTDTPTTDLPSTHLPPATDTPATETPTTEFPTANPSTTDFPTFGNPTITHPSLQSTTVGGTSTTLPTTSTTTSTTISTSTITSPTTSTNHSPTTIPPLVCINGGELHSGVCICPDEWTGDTCSEGNFCNSAIKDGFSFPRTVVGWSAYSEESCDEKTTSAGLPKASARCLNDTGSLMFGPPHELQCEFTLGDILGNISSNSGDLLQLALSTQILTSQPERLSADITTAAQIANTLLQSANITEDIAVAAVTTISQLLNSSEESTQERDAVQNLTETLEKFSLDQYNNVSLVVQPNLAVQSVQVPSDSVGIQFTALTGRSGNFVANIIHLNTNTSELIVDKGGSTDVQIVIKFPSVLHSKTTNHSIGFVLYQNDRFFRSKAFRASSGTSRRVISANLGQVSGLHVEMLFKPTAVPNTSLYDFACVSWNYTLKDWSTFGCSKVNHSADGLRCFCNHTTNFAVLMSFKRDFKYAEALNWITTLGCSMSIIGLSLTITFQITTRKSRKTNPTVLLVSVCMCLLIFTLLFMLGVDNPHKQLGKPKIQEDNILPPSDTHTEQDRGPCTAVAVLLQYFLLGTFTWNTLYATHVFLMIRNSLATSPSHFTAYTVAIGWGLPAVVVSLTLGISYRVDDPLGYRQEEFCWLAALDPKGNFDFKLPMFWGFLVPVAFMLIFNTVVLVCFTVTTTKTNPHLTSTRHTSMKKKFLSSFSLAVVLGLSWILGYLLLIPQNQTMYTILNISFCVLTTTQGLQIFILFTARTAIVKKKMSSTLKSISSFGIPLHTRKYSLWRGEHSDNVESYTQQDTDLSFSPCSTDI